MTLKEIYKTIKKNPKPGCWIWSGAVAGSGNHWYGHANLDGKHIYIHRLMYEIHRGKIKKGMTIDHLCKVTRCVNPKHLDACTLKENILRGTGRGALNARKVVCRRGHAFVKMSDGTRYCFECARISYREYYAKNREKELIRRKKYPEYGKKLRASNSP